MNPLVLAIVAALWLGGVVFTLALCRAASFAPPLPSEEEGVSTHRNQRIAG